jgi:predicted dehydrogenase
MYQLKKLLRFITIYGISRTLFKVFGRLRVSGFRFPSFKKRNIGLVGCGQFGFATIGYFISKKSPYNFLKAFDIDKKNQSSFEKFHNLVRTESVDEIFEDEKIETMYIASNHYTHTQYAIKAIENNKTVYIEKPISVNYEQFKSLLETIKKYDANIFAGYNRPFSGAVLDLKKSIGSFEHKPFSINYFISGHLIEKDHWYRNSQEGTRICGNVGHWLDLTIHILSWRRLPNILDIAISYSNLEEIDDNISITITTEFNDIISIMLTSRCEPFEGINETINFQYDNTIAKIDDFRRMTIWQDEKLINKKYWPKDVGHHKAILQPFNVDKYKRDWSEVENSTLLMLFITDMVLNKETSKEFKFDKEWEKLNNGKL